MNVISKMRWVLVGWGRNQRAGYQKDKVGMAVQGYHKGGVSVGWGRYHYMG